MILDCLPWLWCTYTYSWNGEVQRPRGGWIDDIIILIYATYRVTGWQHSVGYVYDKGGL